MNDLDFFEKWFAETYGARPATDIHKLELELSELKKQIKEKELFIEKAYYWVATRDSAKAAWQERGK